MRLGWLRTRSRFPAGAGTSAANPAVRETARGDPAAVLGDQLRADQGPSDPAARRAADSQWLPADWSDTVSEPAPSAAASPAEERAARWLPGPAALAHVVLTRALRRPRARRPSLLAPALVLASAVIVASLALLAADRGGSADHHVQAAINTRMPQPVKAAAGGGRLGARHHGDRSAHRVSDRDRGGAAVGSSGAAAGARAPISTGSAGSPAQAAPGARAGSPSGSGSSGAGSTGSGSPGAGSGSGSGSGGGSGSGSGSGSTSPAKSLLTKVQKTVTSAINTIQTVISTAPTPTL